MDSNDIHLRPAHIDDLKLLQHWDEQQHNIDSDPNDEWNWEEELKRDVPWREQLIAELQNRPIGFVQIIDPALEVSKYWGEVPQGYRAIDIWIGEAVDLNKGYGTKIMQLVLTRCFASPTVKAVWIDPLESNKNAIRFYERMGFRFVEKRKFNNDECLVYALTRDDWNKRK